MERIFGSKEEFAIEIKVNGVIEKSNLRLWIQNNPVGYYKKMNVLTDSVKNFKKLLFHKSTLYNQIVDLKNPEEIFQWMLSDPKEPGDFESRMKYIRWMGEQLDEFSMIAFFNKDKFQWIVYDVKKKKVFSYLITEADLVNTSADYINWYESQYGEVTCDYNKFP
jgi:hypothetical protein